MLHHGENAKLLPEQEEALLASLKTKRELDARIRLQAEAQATARKIGDIGIEKVPDAAEKAANKDRRNFGLDPAAAVATITLNAVFLDASRKKEAENAKSKGKKDGGYGGGKKAAPKVTSKIERLPPPDCQAVVDALSTHKATLEKVSKFAEGELSLLRALEAWLTLEVNDELLKDAPKILDAFLSEGLVEKETFVQYWASVQSTREAEGAVLSTLKEQHRQAKKDHLESVDKEKAAQDEEREAAIRLRQATRDASQAWGNAQSEQEAIWEKGLNTAKAKATAESEQRSRTLEACHKRQVMCLSNRDAAEKAMREKAEEILPLELMDMNASDWFAALTGSDAKEETN
mmetsp:Transcript_33697/g.60984  ORF Transcript_33697/g.60984 Transcript_33697/m.60984 type:complete len:347 (+) Transcript_33697:67-1107(+)|eukprot:CAMPEP_0197625848 /NCGR_PEP_ID=MMETSP1338-20131121/5095_1 /TAXON_ID=43686 ORGANISM="Pelagodinium beii, Strain RCC1491" /NCGR_SAMPLE_ID=MMETSP1338 /ASSEMBLY_ACC=CAM_ASM_000754 /LENGTH=346 /DNA_ID=CAMNT_0043196353 /DNA_START=47 /DNA_END=1087 /DNA_ORIENTATION=-